MSRLKHKYHIDFTQYPALEIAWKNTPIDELSGWEMMTENNRVSTYALVWSFWNVWVGQLNDPAVTNYLHIQWLFRDLKLFWPLGSFNIPTAALGQAKLKFSVLALDEKNALI